MPVQLFDKITAHGGGRSNYYKSQTQRIKAKDKRTKQIFKFVFVLKNASKNEIQKKLLLINDYYTVKRCVRSRTLVR